MHRFANETPLAPSLNQHMNVDENHRLLNRLELEEHLIRADLLKDLLLFKNDVICLLPHHTNHF